MNQAEIESKVEDKLVSTIAERISKALLRRVQSLEYETIVLKQQKGALHRRIQILENLHNPDDPREWVANYAQMKDGQTVCSECNLPMEFIPNFPEHLKIKHQIDGSYDPRED